MRAFEREALVYATVPPSSSLAAVLLLRWALACTERGHSPSAGGFRESTHFVR